MVLSMLAASCVSTPVVGSEATHHPGVVLTTTVPGVRAVSPPLLTPAFVLRGGNEAAFARVRHPGLIAPEVITAC